jgi:hypothetical protein
VNIIGLLWFWQNIMKLIDFIVESVAKRLKYNAIIMLSSILKDMFLNKFAESLYKSVIFFNTLAQLAITPYI